MATLVLQAAGTAVGGLFGPVGAILGRAAGAVAGNVLDQQLFGARGTTKTIGRIDDLSVQTASEGNPVARVYGRARIAGTVIWATDFEENVDTRSVGGKGGSGQKVREYSYTASFAVGLCEGPIARVGRVWADGEPLDLTQVTMRVHLGGEEQDADPLIEARTGGAPAYRGLAYVVFENLPVGPYGNRLPQLTFEVLRPVGTLEGLIRGVTMIPGATEFGYAPERVTRQVGPGEAVADNRHLGVAVSDIEASLDELQAVCPALESVALVVAWFGDDLRAGRCTLKPAVESRYRSTSAAWAVAGETRATAKVVTADAAGNLSYGGTPSDASVYGAIRAIKARGLKVVLYPFILMDVPPGNGLEDPYQERPEQAAFPWRGRITLAAAPGIAGSPDGTAGATAEIAQFVGSAAPHQFAGTGATVGYSGPAEWTLRRMILHYARLSAQAGGVDAILIGSELRGLTAVRDAAGYPFVGALMTLAADVRTIVGAATKISYAADWTEYHSHRPADGSDTVSFHLDPLWAHPAIDFVGIDYYAPVADWRDGEHRDTEVARSTYDADYLQRNIFGGEDFDWYYASPEDRARQTRSAITDGRYGEPWIYRQKDFRSWWSEPHHDRRKGYRDGMLGPDSANPRLTSGNWQTPVNGATVVPVPGVFLGKFEQSARVVSGGNVNARARTRPIAFAAARPYTIEIFYTPESGARQAFVTGGTLSVSVAGNAGTVAATVSGATETTVSDWDAGGGVRRLVIDFTPTADATCAIQFGPRSATGGASVLLHSIAVWPRDASTTAWVPGSKPVWFTEVGCPAIDKGANQPNVFYDRKSSESELPRFSNGRRDDAMQRAHLAAVVGAFDPATSPAIDTFSPVSPLTGTRLLDPSGTHVWTWDARPWPAFPQLLEVWSDGENWERGHWLTGRLGGAPLDDLLARLFADWNLPRPEANRSGVVLDGFVIAGPSSLRSVLEPLLAATSVIGADTGTAIRFVLPRDAADLALGADDLLERGERTPIVAETREEASSLPIELRLRYFDSGRDYQIASARYRPQIGSARQTEEIQVPATLNDGLATELSEVALAMRWAGRTTVRFALPPSRIALLPGDVVTLSHDGRDRDLVVEEIEDLGERLVTARTLDRAALSPTPVPGSPTPPVSPPTLSPPVAFGVNLPIVDDTTPRHRPWIGVFTRPWPGEMAVWQAVPGGSFNLLSTIAEPASLGEIVAPPNAGPTSRWHYGGAMDVLLYGRSVSSLPGGDVLAGRNALAVLTVNGVFEVIQFRDAMLIGERLYRLSVLLRGQLGTDNAAGIQPGAPVALLDGTLASLPTAVGDIGVARTYRVGPLVEGVGGPNVTTFDFTASGRPLMPFSPIHVRARRQASGAILITWIRRTREGGDPWPDEGDVPLSETDERYRLQVFSGATVMRTVNVTSPSFLYPLANQTADLGGPPTSLKLRVWQLSTGYGAGAFHEVTVDVQQP
jgi:hypothetical protein